MNVNRDALGELVRAVGRRNAPPDDAYRYAWAAAQAALRHKRQARRRRHWLFGLAAMMTTLSIGIATLAHWFSQRPPTVLASVQILNGNASVLIPGADSWRPMRVDLPVPAGARVRTGAGAGVALTLSGGHSLRVDQQSDLLLEAADTLRLSMGAVYVDSGTRRSPGAVRIHTRFGTIRDIGTIFEVRADSHALRVRVREGRIALKTSEGALELRSAAGEQIRVDASGGTQRSPVATSDRGWAWAESLAVAPDPDALPLLHFLAWVSRETGRQLRFAEPGLEAQAREIVLHGTARGLAPLEALDLMLLTTDLDYVLQNEDVILIRRRHG